MEAKPPTLDLRTDAKSQGIELPAGTLLYAVVPRTEMGISGPFFTEPGRALYWGFHVMLATKKGYLSLVRNVAGQQNSAYTGKIANQFVFPGREMILLEIKTDRKIIFSNQMMDANPYAYVQYRYGSHDPFSLPAQVNLDDKQISLVIKNTCREHSWSQPVVQRVFYYGLLTMIPIEIFKSNNGPPLWIAKDQQGRVDSNLSLFNLNTALSKVNPQVEAYHEYIVETGIRICRPSQVTASRSYFEINWEQVYLTFLAFLSQSTPSSIIKNHFITNILQLIIPIRVPHPDNFGQFDLQLLTRILSWCPEICDALALLSVNKKMRERIAPLPLVQRMLRVKFMPKMNTFFTVLPLRDMVEREDLLGVPSKSCGHRWWKVGGVLFTEDFDEVDDVYVGAQPKRGTSTGAVSIDAEGRTPTRAELYLLTRFGSDDAPFEQLSLPPQEITPLIRGCNSFISMFAMLYSMSNFDPTPRGVDIRIHIQDPHGNLDLVNKVMASMPAESVRSSANPLAMLTARPTASYREAVRRIRVCGSWLHDIGTPYFFLDPSFITHLDRAKAFELQRYDIVSYMNDPTKKYLITRDHTQIMKLFLTNDLYFYKDSNAEVSASHPNAEPTTVAVIRCSMKGGFQQRQARRGVDVSVEMKNDDRVLIYIGALTADRLASLDLNRIFNVYRNQHQMENRHSEFMIDDTTPVSRRMIDDIPITNILGPIVRGFEINLRRDALIDDTYYASYMTLCCVIRLILHDGCNRVKWNTNF